MYANGEPGVAERLLQRLSNGGRTGVFLAAFALAMIALLSPGWIGAILTIIIVALAAALMRRTWPVQPTRIRVIKVTILLVLVIFAVYKVR